MFASRYFTPRYWASRLWSKVGGEQVVTEDCVETVSGIIRSSVPSLSSRIYIDNSFASIIDDSDISLISGIVENTSNNSTIKPTESRSSLIDDSIISVRSNLCR